MGCFVTVLFLLSFDFWSVKVRLHPGRVLGADLGSTDPLVKMTRPGDRVRVAEK